MYEDLEAIANLKHGQAREKIAREVQEDLSPRIADIARRGLPNSSQIIRARVNSVVENSTRSCRALYEIWLGLLLQRNKGRISRDDVTFIMAKVDAYITTRCGQLATSLGSGGQGPAPQRAIDEGHSRIQPVASAIRRELEIKIREQDAFPADERSPDISFPAFLRSFSYSWLTLMSGPLTVPLAIIAFLVPGHYKLLFGVLAIISGVFSAFLVWRNERKRRDGQ